MNKQMSSTTTTSNTKTAAAAAYKSSPVSSTHPQLNDDEGAQQSPKHQHQHAENDCEHPRKRPADILLVDGSGNGKKSCLLEEDGESCQVEEAIVAAADAENEAVDRNIGSNNISSNKNCNNNDDDDNIIAMEETIPSLNNENDGHDFEATETNNANYSVLHRKQHEKWLVKFNQVRQFKEEFGSTLVPRHYERVPGLGTWVHNQRTQYKGYKNGNPCRITAERIAALDDIGFVWDVRDFKFDASEAGKTPIIRRRKPQDEKWLKKFGELQVYKEQHGNCLVPQNYVLNRALGKW